MRIGMIAPPFLTVPPQMYGGTELVVDVLARGLQEAGHEVLLCTVGSSTCPVPRSSWFEEPVAPIGLGSAEATHVTAAYTELAAAGVDVIHDHTLLGPLAFAGRVGPPVVTTCHSAFGADLRLVYSEIARRARLVAISHDQQASAPALTFDRVIHHGLDLRRYTPGAGDGGYLIFLARMSPDKGPHRAIQIARAAGRKLVLAAKMREPDELAFFGAVVEPLLGPDINLVGEQESAEMLQLLQGAAALLNPIEWPEPFGLNMIEALACGTPVLTLRHGAAPEIVKDGVSGFVRDNSAELVDCVDRIPEIDRAACRAEVEQHFSMRHMVEAYLDVYARVIRGHDCEGPGEPAAPGVRAA